VSWWAIGWQIYVTKYCEEIEDIFNQMELLRKEIGVAMPGNKLYVDSYIQAVWSLVTALTSAVERYDGAPPSLVNNYENYNKLLEDKITCRLDEIMYDIDTIETVHSVVGGDHIEKVLIPSSRSLFKCVYNPCSIYSCS
jgi:hypothetical protein